MSDYKKEIIDKVSNDTPSEQVESTESTPEQSEQETMQSINLWDDDDEKPEVNEEDRIFKRIDSKIEALNRKEKELEAKYTQRLQELEQKYAPERQVEQVEQKEQTQAENLVSLDELKKLYDENPFKFLERFGGNYEDLSRKIVEHDTPEYKLKRELTQKQEAELKKLRDEIENKEKAKQAEEEQQTILQYEEGLMTRIKDNTELKYINKMNRQHEVFELIQEYYKENPEPDKNIEEIERAISKELENVLKRDFEALQEQLRETDMKKPESSSPTLKNTHKSDNIDITRDPNEMNQVERRKYAEQMLEWEDE